MSESSPITPSAPSDGQDTPRTTDNDVKREKDKGSGGPQRSREGCLTCRRRKIKCDERRPHCAKCRIKNRVCVWPDPSAPSSSSRSSQKRKSPVPPALHLPIHHPPPPAPFQQNHSINPFDPFDSSTLTLPLLDSTFGSWNPPSTTDLTNSLDPSIAFLHPLPSLDDLFSIPFALDPPPRRIYVPPDFLPKAGSLHADVKILQHDFQKQLVRSDKRASLMADPAFLQPYFPSVDERLVMRHYLLDTVHIIMAFEIHRQPWNPWVEVHAPLAFTFLPGLSSACDALRTAILAVGAVHMRYRQDSKDRAGAARIIRSSKAKVLALVLQAIDSQTPADPLSEKDVELILGALLSCTIASSLAADASWHELLTSVLAFVDRLGGASKLIQECPQDRMSPLRFCLEQLATRDVFGCISTEQSPTILNREFSPRFLEAQKWSKGDDEWESIERMFGMSRGMVDLMARACALIAKIRTTGETLDDSGSDKLAQSADFNLRLPNRAIARLGTKETPTPPAMGSYGPSDRSKLLKEATELIQDLAAWDHASSFSPWHPRTQHGNHIYRHSIRIRLLREVYGVSRNDQRVQASVTAIIELATELMCLYGRITWLTWPILIAALNMATDDPARATVMGLLGAFGDHACFDNRAALDLVCEFWRDEQVSQVITPAQAAGKLSSRPFLD